jgi:hypothetical protein
MFHVWGFDRIVLLALGYKPAYRKAKLQTLPSALVLFLVGVYGTGGASGGFYNRINAKWLDIAVEKNRIFYVASDFDRYLYHGDGKISGFGSEIHRLEWHHNFRFDPISKQMIPPTHPSYDAFLPKLTKQTDRNIVTLYKK